MHGGVRLLSFLSPLLAFARTIDRLGRLFAFLIIDFGAQHWAFDHLDVVRSQNTRLWAFSYMSVRFLIQVPIPARKFTYLWFSEAWELKRRFLTILRFFILDFVSLTHIHACWRDMNVQLFVVQDGRVLGRAWVGTGYGRPAFLIQSGASLNR